ncbi:hypothetical protein ACP70R_044133 [Stipagrostis hirtigluma subsp. patula]
MFLNKICIVGPFILLLISSSTTCHVKRVVCMSSKSATTHQKPLGFGHTIWGDFFINYTPQKFQMQNSEEWMRDRIDKLKKEVQGLFEDCKDVVQILDLVDVLQRLGIDHLFEEQIASAISSIHSAEFSSSSLHEVALRLRLLRQQGFWVSPEVFNIFKNEDGSFINDVTMDPKGLLSLYNAAYLLTHNEGALEEAILFARHHLELMRDSLKFPLAEQVTRALCVPLPRTLKRVEALNYILEYSLEERTYNPSILELAKLDFNLLQHLHVKELKAISRWWVDLSSAIDLDYVTRERVVECYFSSYAVHYEKEQARARMIFAKICQLLTVLDDTYDGHATLEECRKLDEAIQRWDESVVSILPEYLKKFFLKVLSNFEEFEDELQPHEKYRSAYIRKVFQTVSRSFLQESEWFHHNYTPSFEEHVNVAIMSVGGQAQCVGLLFGMGDVATKEVFEWAIGCTSAIRAYGEVARYMNDIAAFKNNGRNEKDVITSVECYMKEHKVTSEVALVKIDALVEDAWKTINQALFENRVPLSVIQRVTNMTKVTALFFHDGRDAYTDSKDLESTIKSHFVDPVRL